MQFFSMHKIIFQAQGKKQVLMLVGSGMFQAGLPHPSIPGASLGMDEMDGTHPTSGWSS